MTQTARRLTIFALVMIIFALLFSGLVQRNGRDMRRVHLGTNISCLHPASPACVYAL